MKNKIIVFLIPIILAFFYLFIDFYLRSTYREKNKNKQNDAIVYAILGVVLGLLWFYVILPYLNKHYY